MKDNKVLNPIASAIGATFIVSLAASPLVNANENPFALNNLQNGYMVSEAEVQKCGSICGGTSPQADKNGEMIQCGNTCGEVTKCGSICGGAVESTPGENVADEDLEVAKCGSICAAVK